MDITEQEEQIREEARRDAMLYKSTHQQSTLPQTEEEIRNEAQRDADLYNKHFGKVEPVGEGEQQLLVEKPDQATLQRMKDVELNTWKTEQERKARKYLRWLYEAGYQYINAATLGLVKKILEHEENMPPDVARDIIGQVAHFAGFLTTPVGLSKLGIGIGGKLAAKVLPKIIKSPKVLAWAEKIGEKTIPQVARAMVRGSATLGLASAISDLTNMKDAVKRGKAGALMGLIFSGTSLAHLPEHPIISQMMRQVGGRALLSIANLYDPQIWKNLNKEQIAHRVYDEILNTWFLAKGYSPRVAVMKAAEVKDSIGAESQPTLFTPEELTKVTPWIKKPPEVSEKPTPPATAETPGKARPGEVEIKVEPNPDGTVDIKVKQQINKLTEEEFKKAYKERTLPYELTKGEYTEEQRRWMDEVIAEEAVKKMIEQKSEEKTREVPEEGKLTLQKMKEIYHPDYIMRITETPRGFVVEIKLEDEWSPMMKNAREEAVFKTRRGAEGFLRRQYPKQLEVYEHAVKLARKEGTLLEEETPKEEAPKEEVAKMHIEPQPNSVEALNKKIAEKGTESLTDKELEFLKKKGIFQKVSPTQEGIIYHGREPKELTLKQPAEQKAQTLVDVFAKNPLGKTEKVETIPADMVEKIKEYAKKKGVGDLISFGKPRAGKWTNYLPPIEIKKYIEGYIRTLPRVPEGTSKEEAWRIWEEKVKAGEEGKIESEIKKMVKLEEKVEVEPENITIEDLPFDGAVGKKLAHFTAEVHKAATRKAWRAAKMVDEALSGTRIRAPRVIKKALEGAGMTLDDEIMYNIEEAYAQKIASSARGHVDRYIKKMAEFGVRDEIINSVKVMDRYPITKVIKVKKEKTGIQSAVIPKSLIKYIKEHYRGGKGKKFLWKKSVKYVTKQGKRIVKGFQVPQVFFKHIGLKEILYDPIRQGERDAEEFFHKQLPNLKRIFAHLTRAEREQLFDYMASKQHRAHAMEKAGVKVPKLNDLNMRQQLALVKWKNWMKEYTPKLKELARLYGLDIKFFKNYFPMYTKKGIIEVDGVVDYPKGIRKSPFFKSFIERTEDVPYKYYERDAYKNAIVFLRGMSRALNLGKRTIGLKYLIDSDEFKNIISKDDYAEILDWYENLVGRVEPHRGARKAVSDVARQLRRWSTRAILTNPRVILKQGLSFLDVALMENTKFVMPDNVKQLVKRLSRPTVTERVPEIAIVDMRSKADRALLGGITWADKTFAHGGYSGVLAAELVKMKDEGIPLDNKALRKAIRRVSDRIDLAMGGYTPAQTPHFYRTELGKAVLMFTSTINSRFQYYIENTIDGINKSDAFHIAKAITAFTLGAYLEAAITRLALHWQDSREMLKDILKTGIGNIPPFSSLVYGLEAGELAPTAWFKNINDAIAVMKKPWSRRLIGIAEIFGLPKQLRHTLEGLEAIKKGIKVSSSKTLEVKGFWEQLRAIINGKWGTLAGRQFFVERERKAGWNREIANKLAKIEGKHFRAAIKNMTTKTFKAHFWDYVKALSEGDKKKIREIIKEARKEGMKLSFESILRHLKEAFNE